MKLGTLVTIAALAATPAISGGIAPAVMEEPVAIVMEDSSSFSGWIIPLIIIAVLIAMSQTCRSVNANSNSANCGPS